MFDQFKQLAKLREMQKAIQSQRVAVEKEGIKLTMTGEMKIESLELNPALDHSATALVLKDLHNEAIDKLQRSIASLMQ